MAQRTEVAGALDRHAWSEAFRRLQKKSSIIVGQASGAYTPYADRAIGSCTDSVEVVASCQVIWERLPCGGFAFAHLLAC
jgi:hypothetical protein